MRLHVKNILLQCPSGSENACDFILQDIEHDATGGGAFAFVSGEGAALFLNSLKFLLNQDLQLLIYNLLYQHLR